MKKFIVTLALALLPATPIAVYSSSWKTLEAKNLSVFSGDLKDLEDRCLR